MGRLDGKVALITGGARGQGATEAKLFAHEGAKVVISDVLDEEGSNTEAEIRKAGGEALYVHLDVTKEVDWRAAIETTVRRYVKLNVLVNNAGISARGGIEEISEEDWDRVMEVNAKGVFLGTKHALPAMRLSGGGSIVNISSTGGLVSSVESSPAYVASKAAVRLFSKVTAVQHAKDNIRCNSVHPGPVGTPMILKSLTDTAAQKERLKRVPMGRIARPEEIAYGVLYLASDEASFVTGSELVIDGGLTAH